MPGTLDHVAHLCTNTTAPYQFQDCLSVALGGNDSIRMVNEVWLRSFGIHVVTLASYGHLLSLQGFTASPSGSTYVAIILFLTYPEIALAHFLTRIITTVQRLTTQRIPLRYFFACCLGVRASNTTSDAAAAEDSAYLLVNLDPGVVKRLPQKYTLLWLGRFGLLLALLAQYLGSLVLWIRLVFYLKDKSYWHWHMDYRNFQVVLGGTISTLNSMGILLIGSEWDVITGRIESRLREHGGSPEPNVDVIRTDSGIELLSPAEKACVDAQGRCPPGAVPHEYLSRMQRLNLSFCEFLECYFPTVLQLDFEVAVVIHRVLAYAVVIWTWKRFPDGCPPILLVLSQAAATRDYRKICPDRTNTYDPLTFTLIPHLRKSLRLGPWLGIPITMFSIGLARIVLQWLAQSIILVFSCTKKKQSLWLEQLNYWFLSGRSCLSFPFILLIFSLAPFWFDGLLEQRSWHRRTEMNLKAGTMGAVEQMAVKILMWKDPWQDNLYIM